MTDFIKAGGRYTSRNKMEWECIFVRNGLAWLTSAYDAAPAYVFYLNGTPLSFMEAGYIIDHPKREPMQPPWDVLPEWCKWAAIDENGDVWVYEHEPVKKENMYAHCGIGRLLNLSDLRFPRGNMPWRDSLVRRPTE